MIPQQWASPCGNQCTHRYAALMQIPWRVFCKKGCDADGETWQECLSECNEICYKDPVLKDQQWSAYIDRSPGAANYSEVLRHNEQSLYACQGCYSPLDAPRHSGECFHACVAGCGYKFEMCKEKVDKVKPNRPLRPKPPPVEKLPNPPPVTKPDEPAEDVPSTSA